MQTLDAGQNLENIERKFVYTVLAGRVFGQTGRGPELHSLVSNMSGHKGHGYSECE